MGKRKVKEYTAEFKTKVVLEGLKQEQTQAEIALPIAKLSTIFSSPQAGILIIDKISRQ